MIKKYFWEFIYTDCATTANMEARLDALGLVTAQDGFHFNYSGYDTLTANITGGEDLLMKRVGKVMSSARVY